MYISFIISFLVAISLSILIINNLYVLAVKLCIGFICVLFFGVGIALYLLKELFKEALQYQEENDLTIDDVLNAISDELTLGILNLSMSVMSVEEVK